MSKLIKAVIKTHDIDESGDANLLTYIDEVAVPGQTIEQTLENFLIWSNGPNWEKFLATAEVGDTPN